MAMNNSNSVDDLRLSSDDDFERAGEGSGSGSEKDVRSHIEEMKRRRALLEIQTENMSMEKEMMRMQQLDLNGKPEDDDHNNTFSDNEESGSDYSDMTDTDEPQSSFWLYKFTDSDINDEEDQLRSVKYDLSKEALQRAPRQPPSIGGVMLLPRANKETVYARLEKDANIVLEEYNMREGFNYEYESMIRSRPACSPDNPEQFVQHMNFWARRKFTFTSPELFFGSLGYGVKRLLHVCKLNLDPDSHGETTEIHELLHCEHVKCSDCSLWKFPRA